MIAATAILMVAFVTGGCGGKKVVEKTEIRVPVTVSKPVTGDVTLYYETTGTIVAEEESRLSFPSGGRVIDIAVDAGDVVTSGQVLARVDSVQFQQGWNAAKAGYSAASDGVKAQEAGAEVAKNQLADAQNRFAKVKADYERFKVLYEKEVITKKEYEDIETAYHSAELGVENAKKNVTAMELQVQVARNQAEAAKAGVDQASKVLSDAVLVAPYSGTIAERMIQVGEVTGPGEQAFRLTSAGVKKVTLQIPEEYHGRVEVGKEVEIDVQYLNGNKITANLTRVNPDVAESSRSFSAEVLLPDGYDLMPGSFCIVKLAIEKVTGVMTLPLAAVMSFGDQKGVFVNVSGVAKKKIITLGITESEIVQVVDGLSWDDEVVVVGNRFLTEGAKLEAGKTGEEVAGG
jgi:multidrug efflux pump subunit AcrA (membrane-fusion protein)